MTNIALVSSTGFDTLPRMASTTTHPTSSDLDIPAPTDAAPTVAQVDAMPTPDRIIALSFLACCHRCDLTEPFTDEDGRDAWAAKHARQALHSVHVTIEVDGEEVAEHTSAVLRYRPHGAEFMCTHPDCERWNGPYGSGLIALDSFRAHRRSGD